MIILNEGRHLSTLTCYYNQGMDVFVFSCEGRKTTLQHVSPQQVARLFQKVKVKDYETTPKSLRGKTYMQMVNAIMDGSDTKNYLWSVDIPLFFASCKEITALQNKVALENESSKIYRKEKSMVIAGARKMQEAGAVPAIAKVAGVSANPRITSVARQNTIYGTLQTMGLPVKVNAMNNVVAEVSDMQTAGAVLQTIYQQFGVKGSFMVTWEGKGKLYWDPRTPVDRPVAIAYAKGAGLPPPNPRKYMESISKQKAKELADLFNQLATKGGKLQHKMGSGWNDVGETIYLSDTYRVSPEK